MRTPGTTTAFTSVELLVVSLIVIILAALFWPVAQGQRRVRNSQCLNNQNQIALVAQMFKDDHARKYPWQESVKNGGSLELISHGVASEHFATLASYLHDPEVLYCPSDRTRTKSAMTDFAMIDNSNISYFVNLDATGTPSILTGDRHLLANGKAINPGLFACSTNSILSWADGYHYVSGKPSGAMSFADGHVQFLRQDALNARLQKQPVATNRFCFP